jgi:hypothetical protein
MLDPDAKVEIVRLVRESRDLRASAPLLDGIQASFKSAADLDSSASPIEQGLIDALGSGDSGDDAPANS